jgi:NAD(P)-dependent dehydrogenase (short-subunit alcohol dehydrogenase family)
MSDDLELNGCRALVTGGTQGIGEAVVARLREAGVKVLTTARTTPAELRDANLFVAADVATARRLRDRGRRGSRSPRRR